MRNARLWLWGLVPLALIWIFSTWTLAPIIEADLAGRTNLAARTQGLPWAKALIEGRDAELASVAPSQEAKAKALDIFAGVVGVRRVSANGEVQAPVAAPPPAPPLQNPYVWSATRSASGLALGGYAPDKATLEANAAEARGIFAGIAVNDAQALGSGAPAGYTRLVLAALRILAKLDEGKANISNDVLTITGKANTADVLAAVQKLIAEARAGGLKLVDQLTPPPPVPASPAVAAPPAKPEAAAQVVARAPEGASAGAQACGARVKDAIGGRSIHFASSMRFVPDEDMPLIRSIADALRACGAVKVAIEGHTDNEGAAGLNQNLSEKRAAEVVKALKAAGAPEGDLTSAGFGESNPLAPNTTRENKAKNRRVEIIIR